MNLIKRLSVWWAELGYGMQAFFGALGVAAVCYTIAEEYFQALFTLAAGIWCMLMSGGFKKS